MSLRSPWLMATTTRKTCSTCGAPRKKGMSLCFSCATPYFVGDDVEKPPRETRFGAAEATDGFQALLEKKPSYAPALLVIAKPILLGIVLAAIGRGLRPLLLGEESALWKTLLIGIPLTLILFAGVITLIVGIVRFFRFTSAPLVRRLALITRKRTLAEGGDLRKAVGKPLIIHVEFRTENRDEVRASGSLAGRLGVDDLGVVYIKGPFLLDFAKLDA